MIEWENIPFFTVEISRLIIITLILLGHLLIILSVKLKVPDEFYKKLEKQLQEIISNQEYLKMELDYLKDLYNIKGKYYRKIERND